ncbi:MAG: beta-L-arabinofuranosidase domain-containing protein, partial [Eubacteriales bacterium]
MKNIPQIYDYNSKLAVPDKLFTPLSGVKLAGGLFSDVYENNKQFLRKLDMGAMMYWFDKKTGTPTDATPYTGHFEDNLKGSTLSMFLMGAANSLRWSDDEELARRVHILMERLRTAADADGFLMPVDERDFAHREYPHYVRIWLTYALCAVGLSCGEGAYDILRRWQDWFNSCPDLPIIKYLELAFQGIVASTYVYTTPIGEKLDIDKTIEAYEEPWRLAQFMRRERDCVSIRHQPGREPHAHGSELEGIEGYLDLYRATGRNYYLTAVLGAWELYRADWQHVGGGIVMCEGMEQNYPGCYWLDMKNNYNELCCTSFWIFLNQRLHRLFPDREVYVGEIEKSLYNVAIANQDGGDGIRYFAYLEGHKQESGLVHCCCGVGT